MNAVMNEREAFRRETREWLEKNCPPTMRGVMTGNEDLCWGGRHWKFKSEDQRLWLERMVERGWTAPEWPKQYGGGGLSKEDGKILREEIARLRARPPLVSFGLSMIGPAILRFGDEALKRQHIPPIVRGEIRWCQGYSEPNAGSDLAGLQTRAEDRGDHFIVNGQKVWTSYADKADWMFCLVRTNAKEKKQLGISLVLFDMTTPGVTTRPIKLISGSSPFCETFLDNVRVEKNQVVGEIDQGWTVAKYLLTHEREMISSIGLRTAGSKTLGQHAIDVLGLKDGRLTEEFIRADIAKLEIDARAFELTLERVTDEAKAGQGVGNTSAMLKYYGTELNKRRHELIVALYGGDAMVWEGAAWNDGARAREWLRSKGNSIEGGTTEVQLNVIARNILGLN
jgi:alkylation response protein AidB-like acyl-CoA dehydrogenase